MVIKSLSMNDRSDTKNILRICKQDNFLESSIGTKEEGYKRP